MEIETLIEIARQGGEKILEIYERDFEQYEKEDKSPLTEADLASNKIICDGLKKHFPNIPILSEEGKHLSYQDRKKWNKFFLVDPLDGTKEFIKKNGEFTVNIALVEGNRPVLGVVYVPVQNITYFAQKNEGAYLIKNEKKEKLPTQKFSSEKLIVMGSKSHLNEETKEFVKKLEGVFGKVEFQGAGSSLKLCMVAEGIADCYPRLGLTSEWDTAAAQIIVEEAEGEVLQYESREPVIYNKENLLNPFFLVNRKEIIGKY